MAHAENRLPFPGGDSNITKISTCQCLFYQLLTSQLPLRTPLLPTPVCHPEHRGELTPRFPCWKKQQSGPRMARFLRPNQAKSFSFNKKIARSGPKMTRLRPLPGGKNRRHPGTRRKIPYCWTKPTPIRTMPSARWSPGALKVRSTRISTVVPCSGSVEVSV